MRWLVVFLVTAGLIIETVTCLSQGLPIRPARTLRITTHEGTYMNVDVSPDGRTLVFDLLGDLFLVPVYGGDATQLTRGIALHLRPVWSPDGKRIAYFGDASGSMHLTVMDREGKIHRVLGKDDPELFYGLDAVWAPDSRRIYIGTKEYALGNGKTYHGPGVNNVIRFSPDGKWVYSVDSGKIYRFSRTTKENRPISGILNSYNSGILSPDARWWCYLTDSNGNESLIVENLTMNARRVLVPTLIQKDPRYRAGVPRPHFCFSPNSKTVFIAYAGKIHRIDVEDGRDRIVPFTARVRSDLGPFDYHTFRVHDDSVRIRYTRSANLSPDGKHLIFSALDRIYQMDLPNGKPYALAPQPVAQFQPVYSPDGRWIAYTSWCDTTGGGVWRVPALGGVPQQLTSIPGEYQRPAWSPDGTSLAIIRGLSKTKGGNDPETGCLEIIPLNGGPIRTIDDSVPLSNQLSFSPDGHKVTYTPRGTHAWVDSLVSQLVEKELNGTDSQILAVGNFRGFPFFFCEQMSISPDGRFLVYSADEDLYLVPLDGHAVAPVMINKGGRLPRAVRFASGVDPYWSQGGKVLAWTYGNRFYEINPDKIYSAIEKMTVPRPVDASLANDFIAVKVDPDKVISMNVAVPCLHARGTLVLKNAQIITMQGDKVIDKGTIVVRDGRIAAVGPANLIVAPPGAKQIDLAGKTVIPGLIDVHLHLHPPSNIFPQQYWAFLINLAYGVTTARDPASNFDSFGYGELLQTGQMIGPRLFTVGRPVRFIDGVIRLDNPAEARSVVLKRAQMGATVVKNYLPPRPRARRELLLLACAGAGLNMTNEGWYDPIMELTMIKDGSTGVEHNPLWGDVYQDVTAFVAGSGTYFTPTLQVSNTSEMAKEYFKYKYWHHRDEKLTRFGLHDSSRGPTWNGAESVEEIVNGHATDTAEPSFVAPARIDAQIRKMGGHVTVGSHGNDEGIGIHNELWAFQMGGFTNMDILRAATMMGAKALGIQQDVGSIEVGKIADLVILDANPLQDIHNTTRIRYVMKDGLLYDGNTLNILWPMDKKCPQWKLKSQ